MSNKEIQKDREQKPKERLNAYARFSGMGFQMIAIIGLGVYAGIKLDENYPNKHNLFTLICSLVAIGMALYFVINKVSNISKKDNLNEQKNK